MESLPLAGTCADSRTGQSV